MVTETFKVGERVIINKGTPLEGEVTITRLGLLIVRVKDDDMSTEWETMIYRLTKIEADEMEKN